jgi:hypothetical protein
MSEKIRSSVSFIRSQVAYLFCAIAVLLFCTAALSEAFKLPDTGQTKCYRGVSPYDEIPCAGTGQDGEYNINPMSFTYKGNGTVTDNRTGLVWQQAEPGLMNWQGALDYCNGLELDNKTDWQLPNIKELESLVDDARYIPAIDTNFFPKANASYFGRLLLTSPTCGTCTSAVATSTRTTETATSMCGVCAANRLGH